MVAALPILLHNLCAGGGSEKHRNRPGCCWNRSLVEPQKCQFRTDAEELRQKSSIYLVKGTWRSDGCWCSHADQKWACRKLFSLHRHLKKKWALQDTESMHWTLLAVKSNPTWARPVTPTHSPAFQPSSQEEQPSFRKNNYLSATCKTSALGRKGKQTSTSVWDALQPQEGLNTPCRVSCHFFRSKTGWYTNETGWHLMPPPRSPQRASARSRSQKRGEQP